MIILKILFFIMQTILFLYGFHFAFFTIISFFKKPKEEKSFKPEHKFLILIPARNEEEVIPLLIASLKEQDYPKDMYQIYVIPNNCTDNTKKVSKEAGAKILNIDTKVKTKGDVLNYAFKKFQKDTFFDTYVIFDADNVVNPNFLKEMNNKLLNGFQIVQGCRDTKNLYDTWLSGSYALSYYLQNIFLYKSREIIGASANLNGTGYVVSKEVIEKTKFQATTLTEDLELNAICAINNIRIGYSPKAVFYDEQVASFIPSIKQRKRWCIGTIQILKKHLKGLFHSLKANKSIHALDNIYLAFGPYFQTLMLVMGIVNVILSLNNLTMMLAFAFLSYLMTVGLSLFLILYYHKNVGKSLLGILLFPLFTVTGILSSILAIFSKSTIWEEVKHTKKISINEILSESK